MKPTCPSKPSIPQALREMSGNWYIAVHSKSVPSSIKTSRSKEHCHGDSSKQKTELEVLYGAMGIHSVLPCTVILGRDQTDPNRMVHGRPKKEVSANRYFQRIKKESGRWEDLRSITEFVVSVRKQAPDRAFTYEFRPFCQPSALLRRGSKVAIFIGRVRDEAGNTGC